MNKKTHKKIRAAIAALRQAPKLALLNIALSIAILVRVEQLHAAVNSILLTVQYVGGAILIEVGAASEQFDQAVRSIMTLFGGDGA